MGCSTFVGGLYHSTSQFYTFFCSFSESFVCVRKRSMQKVKGTIIETGERDMYMRVLTNKVLIIHMVKNQGGTLLVKL
jgi:hypothetical protein